MMVEVTRRTQNAESLNANVIRFGIFVERVTCRNCARQRNGLFSPIHSCAGVLMLVYM